MNQPTSKHTSFHVKSLPSSWEWMHKADMTGLEGQLTVSGNPGAARRAPRSRFYVWLIRLSTSILLWTCLIQLMALAQLWHPHLFRKAWPSCGLQRNDLRANNLLSSSSPSSGASYAISSNFSSPHLSPRRYKNNGYLQLSCNGGLNQMRAAICDMVAVARYLNLTLIVPELDKASFWADPRSPVDLSLSLSRLSIPHDFEDIFDVDHFISSLRDEVRILKKLPSKFHSKLAAGDIISMPPISWSNESYYMNQILPLIKKHKVLHFSKTDTRLANNGLPIEMQKLRCKVNFEVLTFTRHIEELGRKIVKYLEAKGPFLVLHLRYEMDMLAFSGCTHGCTEAEAENLTKMRYAYPWWKEKVINSEQRRLDGLCPLTPEETVLFLQALGFKEDTQIYIAAGEIYGSQRRMGPLYAAYPNIVKKEMILSPEDLKPFQNHSSQMAAIDYLVAIASDVFLPTYDGNMAKVVEGHRRYLGFKKTILPDRKKLVELVDRYNEGLLMWHEFCEAVLENHYINMDASRRRKVIPDKPKEEDYFYSNPEECLS